MIRKDNPALLIAGQFSFDCENQTNDIIKKAVDTCSNTSLPIPNDRYYEAISEGLYHGPACTCARCNRIDEKTRRKFQ